jgi:hypothetical protein
LAVTTDTLLGVETPVMGGVVGPPPLPVPEDELPPAVDAGPPDPPHPASRPATTAKQAMPRSVIRNSLDLISNTSIMYGRSKISWRCCSWTSAWSGKL